ncbi:RNA polymerase sigma factor [Fusobacterium necrophorum]|uniref:Sigma-70 region 2 n=4 Tax=Fusobacterium necrophorum TaxID=859 RepID=A0AAN4ATQ5_9FUSO|nr:RNA polymerase sigma factor [Fusobacterium necrophorum]EHO21077.1 sigma-70 family RNA polymerase sigma factor [Fusobacterium necrophorum subsp. funduliforme 1_1_36S]AVQ20778.1 RNA polymerase sigma factor [Fusobacterium necrophorum subsp. funduliforme]AYV92448.1 RNA polymerase sigma factor [Fusobacterium necrophorum subsp. funduliforme]AYV94461.1 RNA polymerase sigma factor [Fusobacterium necrophorum subsp. funduliforme]EFS22433.2 Sigma-70 region 2 [Fusobacterium necrophorum D12]
MDFDEIFEQYFDKVYYKVLGIVKNSDDAEDISQEVFISVYKNLKKFKGESSIYTWIYRIAINKTYDFLKKNKTMLEINEEILSLEYNVDMDRNMILAEKLKKISMQEREFVILKDLYGYKLKEIAEMKDMNLSTVKSIYYKAIRDMGGNE